MELPQPANAASQSRSSKSLSRSDATLRRYRSDFCEMRVDEQLDTLRVLWRTNSSPVGQALFIAVVAAIDKASRTGKAFQDRG